MNNERVEEPGGDRRTRELEVLAESSRLLTATLDLAEVLDRLAGIARARIGVDVARIWVLDDGGTRLRLGAQKGSTQATAGVRDELSPHGSIAGWVITQRRPLCLTDVQRDERLANRDWFEAEGFTSVLCVPILLDDRAMGMLGCLSRTRREFTDEDVSLAEALTAPAVAALRNAALYADALARVEEIESFQRVASETLAAPELDTVLRVVVRETRRLLRSDAALCTYVDQRTGRMRTLTGEGTLTDGIPGYRPREGEGVAGLALRERRPIRTDDYLADPRFSRSPAVEAWARAEGIACLIAAPVLDVRGEMIAFLWAFNRTPVPFTERHESTIAGLARQTALAIDKARSFDEERRRAEQTAALLEIARACASTLELKPLLAEIARRTAGVIGVDACAICLWNGRELVPVMAQFADGHADRALWDRFRNLGPRSMAEVPAHAAAVKQRHPIIAGHGGAFPLDDWFGAFDLASALVVPLISKDQVVGTMSLIHQRERRWQKEQMNLAMTVAAQVSLGVDTARHFSDAQRRATEVETLAAIGETLTSTLDLPKVLDTIIDSATTLIGAQCAAVFELDRAAGCLRARAVRGIDLEPGFTLQLGQGGAGAAAERLAPVWSADVLTEPLPRFDDIYTPSGLPLGIHVRRYHCRGLLAVPVLSRDTALGAVCVYWHDVHRPDEREIRLLSALARQAAIAMDNARLVGDLRRTLDDLRAAQETLVRGATLRAVGELAAGAAHHLNNLMAVVLGRTQLLLMKDPDSPIAASLRSIERAAADAADTVVRIQGFSRTAKRGETTRFDLNAAVQEAIEFTRSRWQDEAQLGARRSR
jgi:GAF domain-containing protein